MLISIIDDNICALKLINELVDNELKKYTNNYHIDTYNDPGLFDFQKNYTILLLDINMPKNGIELAKEYISFHKNSYIIFITNHVDYVFNTFDVHPYHFIRKYEIDTLLPKVINSLIKKLDIDKKSISINTKFDKKKLLLTDIMYIISEKHYCTIVTKTSIYRIREKLPNLLKQINDNAFCLIRINCIINWKYVDSLNSDMIKLDNKTFFISRSKIASVHKSYFDYIGNQI